MRILISATASIAFGFKERTEKINTVLWANSDPLIYHFHSNVHCVAFFITFPVAGEYCNFVVRFTKFDRVLDQIYQNLLNA